MIDTFIQLVYQHPAVVTSGLVICPLLALAVAGLMEASGLDLWDD